MTDLPPRGPADPRVIGMDGRPIAPQPLPVTDFWFARMEARDLDLDATLTRLDRRLWLLTVVVSVLLLVEGLRLAAEIAPRPVPDAPTVSMQRSPANGA